MTLRDMTIAVNHAKAELHNADQLTDQLISLLVGRLRCAKSWQARADLRKLKKELVSFDARTQTWKEERR